MEASPMLCGIAQPITRAGGRTCRLRRATPLRPFVRVPFRSASVARDVLMHVDFTVKSAAMHGSWPYVVIGRGTPSDFPAVNQSDSFDGSETWSPLYGLLSGLALSTKRHPQIYDSSLDIAYVMRCTVS